MKVRVIIADDEEYCRLQCRRFLSAEENAVIVAECSDGLETLNAIYAAQPDIVFMDIKMPELDGFEVLEQFEGERIPAIVFVSAFDQFALKAFDSDIVDYLLKPFDQERFQRAFRRALNRVPQASRSGNETEMKELFDFIRSREKKIRRFTVKSGDRFLLINPEDVDWISSADNYSELHVGKATHLLRSSITALAEQLADRHFVRINRSSVVNQERVRQIARKSHGDAVITLAGGATLIATRTYRHDWQSLLQERP